MENHDLQYFIDKIQSTQDKLNRAFYFLKWASGNPKLFFTDAKRELGTVNRNSNSNILFAAMNYERELNTSPEHDLQLFIGKKLSEYLQTWLFEKGYNYINNKFHVEVRQPNSFPSIYCVKYEDTEILQFNIYEQWYGIRVKPRSKEKIVEEYTNLINQHKGNIKGFNDKLQYYENGINHLFKSIHSIKDLYAIIFKKNKLKLGYNNISKKLNRNIEREQNSIDDLQKHMEPCIKLNFEIQCTIDIIQPLFKEIKYDLRTEGSWLY